ncbi:hypothetical protein PHYBLDRAFT_72687 [Phycomyces blakesleeanus NRRL 1555(-)]|uniref:Uncharacterized protein n=1 Tax=Phycomyces blakesleeanus (strain ATCC 8743b / DSM 1359 / FGSC 10004 / NBRC 33097 / NRRL 1555) TaxID=763407 RepID=A0A163DK08_PHYB8|nr:hypothetical protein PHYBLDRAFT_72687 [Phycomyces blakesleeanus NRRL 1555(-)]OAD71810.1 hypothetical protein PHYBLDRAFT_72687 [Phycomyces blakesleeanus NRRL 1555(-)]|eukprot:XP_018289850.1 hypothetical protein PHYBLDRAFT_72687 [Phycomyces blakesleeanus NRRL 1555(-)]
MFLKIAVQIHLHWAQLMFACQIPSSLFQYQYSQISCNIVPCTNLNHQNNKLGIDADNCQLKIFIRPLSGTRVKVRHKDNQYLSLWALYVPYMVERKVDPRTSESKGITALRIDHAFFPLGFFGEVQDLQGRISTMAICTFFLYEAFLGAVFAPSKK